MRDTKGWMGDVDYFKLGRGKGGNTGVRTRHCRYCIKRMMKMLGLALCSISSGGAGDFIISAAWFRLSSPTLH